MTNHNRIMIQNAAQKFNHGFPLLFCLAADWKTGLSGLAAEVDDLALRLTQQPVISRVKCKDNVHGIPWSLYGNPVKVR